MMVHWSIENVEGVLLDLLCFSLFPLACCMVRAWEAWRLGCFRSYKTTAVDPLAWVARWAVRLSTVRNVPVHVFQVVGKFEHPLHAFSLRYIFLLSSASHLPLLQRLEITSPSLYLLVDLLDSHYYGSEKWQEKCEGDVWWLCGKGSDQESYHPVLDSKLGRLGLHSSKWFHSVYGLRGKTCLGWLWNAWRRRCR